MNEQLQQSLVKIITQATESIDASVSFLSGQLPDVIGQLLQWRLLSASLTLVLSLTVMVIVILIVKKVMNKPEPNKSNCFWWWHSSRHEVELLAVVVVCLSLVASAIAVINFIISLYEMLQIMIAPKIYLIEYASSLVS